MEFKPDVLQRIIADPFQHPQFLASLVVPEAQTSQPEEVKAVAPEENIKIGPQRRKAGAGKLSIETTIKPIAVAT